MVDLDTIMTKIEEMGVQEIDTKELVNYGLNQYYIKKAIDCGKLEKIARGKYQVVKVVKDKLKYSFFLQFVHYVLENNFEQAYGALKNSLDNQTDHSYDNHMRIYFILLSKILGYDMKQIYRSEELLEFSENINGNNSYYSYFIKFREEVQSYHFKEVYFNLKKFKEIEKDRMGWNRISTKVFYHLMKTIYLKEQQETRESSLEKNQIMKNRAQQTNREENNERMYQALFKSFMNAYKNEKYLYAIQLLKETLPYASSENKIILENLIRLLTTYLEILERKFILNLKNLNYETMGKDYQKIVQYALLHEDYLFAYQNIGKCIYFDSENTILRLYRDILQKIVEKNEQNLAQLENKEMEVTRGKEEVSVELIYQLIYDREYEQVKQILENYFQVNRYNQMYHNVLKMLKDLDDVVARKLYQERTYFYENNRDNHFERLFEALRYRDYREAYQMVVICENARKRKNPDDCEFTIYRYLIEDLLEKIEFIQHRSYQIEKIDKIQSSIDSYIFSPELSKEKIEELYQLLLEKIKEANEIEEVNDIVNTEYDEYAIQLIDMLNLSCEKRMDASYFESFDYEEKSIVDKFFKAIQLGDYVTAISMIMSHEWIEKTKKQANKKYFILYKKILAKIDRNLKQTFVVENENEVDEEQQLMKFDHLVALKRLVKKRDFVGAYSYYQEYLSENIDFDTKQVMDVLLLFLMKYQSEEAENILSHYIQSFQKGDFVGAREFLKQYEEFIQGNSLNRNIDYHYSRIDSMEQECFTPSFVEKEQLYDYAKYCMENKDYQKCIDAMNRYISLDEDLSARGYLLRGRAYEFLKHYDQAKADYEKSLSIIPEPNAFYRLGRVSHYQGNVQDSLKNHLEYEERRPHKDSKNMLAISDIYQELGDIENSKKYHDLAKHAIIRKLKK